LLPLPPPQIPAAAAALLPLPLHKNSAAAAALLLLPPLTKPYCRCLAAAAAAQNRCRRCLVPLPPAQISAAAAALCRRHNILNHDPI
jgi:hypothetical protein